ncbi:unnamed protein product, partial [Mesorhabditis belari]|uniref:Uncharacterized protein n=1 Tax=Mesorhabditis belari TaxID=2138241 RepID=A0AAF3EKB6_9BILA
MSRLILCLLLVAMFGVWSDAWALRNGLLYGTWWGPIGGYGMGAPNFVMERAEEEDEEEEQFMIIVAISVSLLLIFGSIITYFCVRSGMRTERLRVQEGESVAMESIELNANN